MCYARLHVVGWLLVAAVSPCAAGDLRVSHLYNLSDFSGTIPYNYAGLHVDRERAETYVVYQNVIRIFSSSGMEIFSFGNPDDGGLIFDVTVDDRGDIYTLFHRSRPGKAEARFVITHRNYRGDPEATIEISGLPPDLTDFAPQKIFHRQGRFLLVEKARMRAVETDLHGAVLRIHDLAALLAIPEADRPDTQISGFDLDRAGNMLITVPVAFRAFVVAPDGTVRSFGRGGSAPGTFSVAAGITADDRGRYYVADKVRSVVMLFDPDFGFITEFGHRGRKPENLIAPDELAVDGSGRVYVTQRRNRGVAVFSVTDDERTDRASARVPDRKEVPQEQDRDAQQELHNSHGQRGSIENTAREATGSS